MNREEAWKLLTEYNKESFHLRHALTVEGIMRYFAKELGYGDQEEYWGNVGLLHDLDFELYPEDHCVKSQELMRAHNVDESIIRSTASHGYGLTAANIAPEHQMEKVLFAIDELSGLIGAAALMRPSKSVQDMELKSLKKNLRISILPQAATVTLSSRAQKYSAGRSTSLWKKPSPLCASMKQPSTKSVTSYEQACAARLRPTASRRHGLCRYA